MSKPAAKRARVEITAAEKKKLCLFKVKNPKSTYEDMMSWFKKTFEKPIGRSTVGDIIRAKDKWIGTDISTKIQQERTRERSPQHQQLEDALFIWLNNMSSKNVAVSDMIRTPSIIAQCRSMPINTDQNYGIDPNADQFRSLPINADQFLSISLNSDQCRSMPINAGSSRIDPALLGIDLHRSELIRIDRQ